MPALRIELFGNLQAHYQGQALTSLNTNRLQSLLAYLLLHGEAPHPREHLAYLLWPESNEAQARTNLRQLLHNLRRALPPDCDVLATDNHTVQFRLDQNCSVDVLLFEDAMRRGDFETASSLQPDELLRGLYDDWIAQKRTHYRQELETALGHLTKRCEQAGDLVSAIRHAERLTALDPLRESYHQLLIRLHSDNNDRASALRAYHQCLRTMRRELGVEPGPATKALFDRTLQAKVTTAGPSQPEAPIEEQSALVGREKELAQLQACWRNAMAGGIHFAVICGEPGIGKSRLANAVAEAVRLSDGASVARGRCYAAQGQLAYAPVADWLRAAPLRQSRALLPESQLSELARVLPELLTENPALARPRAMTESWERHHFYDSLAATFSKAKRPLLLLIDDLQWCDSDSFEWLHSLFRMEQARGIFVLGTARTEEITRSHPLTRLLSELRRTGQGLELALTPLSPDETAGLAKQIGGHALTREEAQGLYRSTQGNPLFVIESIRAGDSQVGMPEKVQAVIAGRLAQLSAPAYELAGLASAIGRPFTIDLLAKSTDWDEASISKALEELWQRRLIESREGDALFDFSHDRLREVAYSELSPIRRRFLHKRIALGMEELNLADLRPVSSQLAAHYAIAGMAEEAIRHYRSAAAVAQQRFADAEAADLLRRALALCTSLPESSAREQEELELLLTLGPVLVTTRGYSAPEVGTSYERAFALSQKIEKQEYFLPVLSGMWVFHIVRGDIEKSRDIGRQFVKLAGEAALPSLEVAGHFVLGSSSFHLGEFAVSEARMQRVLATRDNASRAALKLFAGPDMEVFCRAYLAHVLWFLGRTEEADQMIGESLQTAIRVGHPFGRAIAMDYDALLQVFRGNSKLALERAEEAATLCKRHDFRYYGAVAEMAAGWAMGMEGDIGPALLRLRAAFQTLRDTGAEIRLPFYHGLVAEVYSVSGQTGEALANISNAFAFQNKNAETWAAPYLHLVQGDTLARDGNMAAARLSYQRALEAARQSGADSYALQAAKRLISD